MLDKFELLKRYGFVVTEDLVQEAIVHPDRVDERVDLALALRALNPEHALRVVYKRTNHNIVVVTFYPVRRERYGV